MFRFGVLLLLGCTAAREPLPDHARHVRKSGDTARAADLSFVGAGTLSYLRGDLIFLPDGVEVERLMGLPVAFAFDEQDEPIDFSRDEFYDLHGHVTLVYQPAHGSVAVSVEADDGQTLSKNFNVKNLRIENYASYSDYVRSYVNYMRSGRFVADRAAVAQPAHGGQVASDPPQDGLSACACEAQRCNCSQSCKAGETCHAQCREPDECRCWCSGTAY